MTPSDAPHTIAIRDDIRARARIRRTLFLFVEFVGDYHLNSGPSYLINSGAEFRVTPKQQIDFPLAFGLNENASAYILGVGYSFRIEACSEHRGST